MFERHNSSLTMLTKTIECTKFYYRLYYSTKRMFVTVNWTLCKHSKLWCIFKKLKETCLLCYISLYNSTDLPLKLFTI